MGALAHLVTVANAAGGALGRNPDNGVEGASWRYEFEGLTDADGVLIPQATIASFTCVCNIYGTGGAVIASAAFSSPAAGKFTLTFDESITEGLAGTGLHPRICSWAMSLDDGTDTVQFWKIDDSPYAIHHAETN